MKIGLVGFGAMGRLVAEQTRNAGNEVGTVIQSGSVGLSVGELIEKVSGHDVIIDFSISEAVLKTVEACAKANVPLVEGTTGWKQSETAVKELISSHNAAMVYGANFSVGVNLFYHIVKYASKLFASIDGYEPFIEEAHHSRKRDAPSGTALRLRDFMSPHYDKEISTTSTRAGAIPGTHRVGFDSEADQILLTHAARSRRGFASGALLAANWIVGRKGFYEFDEVIESYLNGVGQI